MGGGTGCDARHPAPTGAADRLAGLPHLVHDRLGPQLHRHHPPRRAGTSGQPATDGPARLAQ